MLPGCQAPRAYPYSESPEKREFVKNEISRLFSLGVIEPSNGVCCCPIALPKKANRKFMLCGDYRRLNNITKEIKYSLSNLENILQQVASMGFFSTLDLDSGHWQFPMDKDSKYLTSVICSQGTFQWTRLPFGLKNAFMVFQRMMDTV